jgi:hypothetical protein
MDGYFHVSVSESVFRGEAAAVQLLFQCLAAALA